MHHASTKDIAGVSLSFKSTMLQFATCNRVNSPSQKHRLID